MAVTSETGTEFSSDAFGAEAIVSFGGGVTAIAVHEGGVPRFVRVLSKGGRELTDAIAHDLEVPVETAEALKRAIAGARSQATTPVELGSLTCEEGQDAEPS